MKNAYKLICFFNDNTLHESIICKNYDDANDTAYKLGAKSWSVKKIEVEDDYFEKQCK